MIVFGLVFVHPAVDAHAYIVKCTPQQNQVLSTAPRDVKIWFDEPVQLVFGGLIVTSQSGLRVDAGDAHIDKQQANLLECSLKPNLQRGVYSIQWRVISADGHPVQGVIPFSIGTSITGAQTATTTGYYPGADMLVIRWLQLLSLTVFLGIVLFWRLVVPTDLRKPLWTLLVSRAAWLSWGGLLLTTLLALPLQTTIDAGVSWSQAFHPGLWTRVLMNSAFGPPWMVQLVLLLVLMMVLKFVFSDERRSEVGSWALLVAGVILALTRSLDSHAQDTAYPALSVGLDVLHMCGASLWVGGLLALALFWRTSKSLEMDRIQRVRDVVRRFGWYAIASVTVLALTGLCAGLDNIPTFDALVHTAYGQTLLVKLALVVVMLVLGATSFLYGRSRRQEKREGSQRRLIQVELGVGVVVLLVTSFLTNLPTARTNPGPVNVTKHLTSPSLTATLQISPNRAGMNQFDVTLRDADGHPLTDVQQVTMTLTSTMSNMQMGTDQFRLTQVRPGLYQTEGMYLTMAGPWNVHVDVLLTNFTEAGIDYRVFVGSL